MLGKAQVAVGFVPALTECLLPGGEVKHDLISVSWLYSETQAGSKEGLYERVLLQQAFVVFLLFPEQNIKE